MRIFCEAVKMSFVKMHKPQREQKNARFLLQIPLEKEEISNARPKLNFKEYIICSFPCLFFAFDKDFVIFLSGFIDKFLSVGRHRKKRANPRQKTL